MNGYSLFDLIGQAAGKSPDSEQQVVALANRMHKRLAYTRMLSKNKHRLGIESFLELVDQISDIRRTGIVCVALYVHPRATLTFRPFHAMPPQYRTNAQI